MDGEQRESIRRHLEITEALLLATSRRTEVLNAVGRAEDADDAQRALRELLGVGEVPAQAVLDTQIRRFTSRERVKLVSVRDELRRQVSQFE